MFSAFFDWLLNQLPWWIFLVLGGIGLTAIFVGLRAMGFSARNAWLAVATGGLAVLYATIYQRGRQAGSRAAQRQQERADQKAVGTRKRIEIDVSGRTDAELRERLKRWQRPQS